MHFLFCCSKRLKMIMFIQKYKDHFIYFDEIFGLVLLHTQYWVNCEAESSFNSYLDKHLRISVRYPNMFFFRINHMKYEWTLDKHHKFNENLLLFYPCCKMYTNRALDSYLSKLLPTKPTTILFRLIFAKGYHIKNLEVFFKTQESYSNIVHTNQAN